MSVKVKICGLSNEQSIKAAVDYGADYIGFVFFPASPRNVSFQNVRILRQYIPSSVNIVAVCADPSDDDLQAITSSLAPDFIQLHSVRLPKRLVEIKERFNTPIIQAVSVSNAQDIEDARQYENVADMLLFDTKPAVDSELPGGNGVSFDWSLLAGKEFTIPWMLSGGLSTENIQQAIKISGAQIVDVSSGVESTRGVKDINLIKEFITKATP